MDYIHVSLKRLFVLKPYIKVIPYDQFNPLWYGRIVLYLPKQIVTSLSICVILYRIMQAFSSIS